MTKQVLSKRNRRREIYLVAGIFFGIAVMMLPFLVHSTMGPASPFAREHVPSDVYGAQTTLSTYDALAEIAWLALPAIFVILVLYWVAGRRTRWSGYDDAVKWSRR